MRKVFINHTVYVLLDLAILQMLLHWITSLELRLGVAVIKMRWVVHKRLSLVVRVRNWFLKRGTGQLVGEVMNEDVILMVKDLVVKVPIFKITVHPILN